MMITFASEADVCPRDGGVFEARISLQTFADAADGIADINILYAAVSDRVDEFFLFGGDDVDHPRFVGHCDGSSYLGAADFYGNYISFWHL